MNSHQAGPDPDARKVRLLLLALIVVIAAAALLGLLR